MVRRDLAGDVEPASLAVADQLEAARGRGVLQVIAAAGQLDQQQVARHHRVLGGARDRRNAEPRRPHSFVHRAFAREVHVLRVLHQRQREVARVRERAAHQLGAPDRPAVVRDRDAPGAA